ncbi:MAG: ribosome recycling factor [Candidatus Portiera sp.]|nr:ribosome recycling factor [Portiera sp.]
MNDFETITKDARHRMESAINVLNTNFSKLRTGRAHSSLVEDIKASFYGTPTPLAQMANINTPDAKTISISPYDKSCLDDIARAIGDSDLGLTPNTTADAVIINIPQLNEETRSNFSKHARGEAEQGRIAIRNVRRDVQSKIKSNAQSEDLEKQQHQQIDKLTEEYIGRVEELLQQKEKDLMQF